jgi:asparagine synthetase B (glutamine-hydrolysing)
MKSRSVEAPVERRGQVTSPWLATLGPRPTHSTLGSASLLAPAGDREFWLQLESKACAPSVATRQGSAIVFDGVIFNREELWRSLDERREPLGDADLMLGAFERWGDAALQRVKGHFAFCLWDARSGSLLAARDRVGVVPLFYSRRGGGVHFSTGTNQFSGIAHSAVRVDPGVVAGMVGRHHPDVGQTFFEGIERLAPGNCLRIRGPSVTIERYWHLPPVGSGAEWVREDELGRFGELLDQAVGRALGDGQGGIFLSGGLDSVSVAAAAVEHSATMGIPKPQALSLHFPGESDEATVQRGVAAQLGIDQTFLDLDESVTPLGLVASGLHLSANSAAPLQNVWYPAYRKLALEGRRRGCDVVLTGGGGDEWLTVAPTIAADLLGSFDFAALAKYVASVHRSYNMPWRAVWRNVLWTNGMRPLLKRQRRRLERLGVGASGAVSVDSAIRARLAGLPGWLAPDPAVRRSLESALAQRLHARLDGRDATTTSAHYFGGLSRSLEHPLFAIDMEEVYENGRQLGMKQYDIYWDADLVEFLYRVPPHLLNSGGRSKGLVRSDLARRFPGLGFDRQKKVLARKLFCSILFEQGGAAWNALRGAPALAQLGVVEPRGLEAHIRSVLANRDEQRVDDLWRILSLESWVRPRV